MNKFYNFIEKIGKHNFILIVFIIIVLLITGIYQTFSLYTESAGISLIDGIKTFKFILGNDTENTVTIASDSSKNIALTVSNNDKIKLKYGIYYSSSDDLTDVELGYKWDTEYLPNGSIDSNNDYVVTIQIENNSDSNVTINFGIKYGLESRGDLQLEVGEHWLDKKWNYPLSEVEAGSYVRYIGNNGCSGMSCYGQNANYVSDSDMGYCRSSNYKFVVNGWRVAYTEKNSSYLLFAGASDCMCTSSDGSFSTTGSCNGWINSHDNLYLHFNNMDSIAETYCNKSYVKDGICDTSTWAITNEDYKKITGNTLTFCYATSNNACGLNNNLINNGSFYWFASESNISSIGGSFWNGNYKNISYNYSDVINGVRPVVKLNDSVVVTGGSGTYKDPYTIDNRESVKDLSGNMNNGALKNNPTWDKKNGTITTNGVDSYVDYGLVGYDFGSNVTFAIRIKFHDTYTGTLETDLLSNFQLGGLGLYLKYGYLAFSIYTDEYKTYYSNLIPEVDKWYTIVGTYNGSNLALYINGELAELNTSMGGVSAVTGNIAVTSEEILVGGNPEPGGGYIDLVNATYSDALIFTRALTSSEISSDYSDEINPTNKDNLLLYYDFKR